MFIITDLYYLWCPIYEYLIAVIMWNRFTYKMEGVLNKIFY